MTGVSESSQQSSNLKDEGDSSSDVLFQVKLKGCMNRLKRITS
ncbi:hypothetical protein ACK3F5_15350 [Photorhabdus asymbiotica UENP]|nr:hypothetical protein [Photorhabdus asymbiotica]